MTTTHHHETTRHAYPPRLRTLTVVDTELLSATMRRFVLAGDALEPEFPFAPLSTATHVKVVVPQPSGDVVLPTFGERGLVTPDGVDLAVRDYTVRRVDPATRQLTLDFVLHEHGPAGRWAIDADTGSDLGVMGPRGYTVFPSSYDRYVLGADETALPALERWIEETPPNARIDAYVTGTERVLPAHDGLHVHWLATGRMDDGGADTLRRAVADAVTDDDHGTFVWAAGESGIVGPLRRHIRAAGLDAAAVDVHGYWKSGRSGSGDHEERGDHR